MTSGGLAPKVNDSHRFHSNVACILFTEGIINGSPVRFLLDSGAVVSVIKQEFLPMQSHNEIMEIKTSAITANGAPLNVVISMERFTCHHTFVVINNLTVECLLGADFLRKHEQYWIARVAH